MPSAESAAADTGITMQMKTSTPQVRARLSREKYESLKGKEKRD